MRKLLFLLCLFKTGNLLAQEINLQGSYGASFIGGESINFVGKDSFYFNGFYCTYGVQGKGTCEIRNNFLYLYFEKGKSKLKKDTLKKAIVTKSVTTDSNSVILVRVSDNHGIPIPYATVFIEGEHSLSTGTTTDSSGQVTLKAKSNNYPLLIKTYAFGIEPGQLKLDSSADYHITLFHRQDQATNKELNHGEVYVYEIDELSEDQIVMRPEKSSERFRKYNKKKE
ncbi:Ig-like domain-containing protein [Ferruginibacter sp. SUN106]|uniref:Ig-like domain-containing protein n=1 Tax=Ferruginibacter sp. SUN106 TaxID=2978348 RepID=UPI003D367CFD